MKKLFIFVCALIATGIVTANEPSAVFGGGSKAWQFRSPAETNALTAQARLEWEIDVHVKPKYQTFQTVNGDLVGYKGVSNDNRINSSDQDIYIRDSKGSYVKVYSGQEANDSTQTIE